MKREFVLVALALPLAPVIDLLIGVMSEENGKRTAVECVDRARDIAARYPLLGSTANDRFTRQRLLQVCLSDPAAFARIMRKSSP